MSNETPFFESIYSDQLQLLFFGGKGGVGKTSLSCTAALHLSQKYPNRSFRLISTDPAHSLLDCLLASPLPQNLTVDEFDSAKALEAFLASHSDTLQEIAKRGTFLDNEDIDSFFKLSLPGMDELFAFLEIARQVKERVADTLIIDTAPTGHTLRLLSLPAFNQKWLTALDSMMGKHRYMKKVFSGRYTPDLVDAFLVDLNARNTELMALLRDRSACCFIPVLLAEKVSVDETMKMLHQLQSLHIHLPAMIVNRLFSGTTNCRFCRDVLARQQKVLKKFAKDNHSVALWAAPLLPTELQGAAALSDFAGAIEEYDSKSPVQRKGRKKAGKLEQSILDAGSDKLQLTGRQLLIFGGKGGVGKTTMACSAALALQATLPRLEHVLLSSDPAHSLADCLDLPAVVGNKLTTIANRLSVLEVDATAEWDKLCHDYDKELADYLAGISEHLDFTFDKEVMERLLDLSPPGLDEIMAITEALGQLEQGKNIIIDSAPTGHLVRLLETPELLDSWLKTIFDIFLKYKTVMHLPRLTRHLIDISRKLKKLRALLSDRDRAALVMVTIPTEMALAECKDLLASCNRLGLSVAALIINMAMGHSGCPRGEGIDAYEQKILARYREEFNNVEQIVVRFGEEPVGLEYLTRFGKELFC